MRYRFTYLDRLPRRPRRLFQAARRVHYALMRWLVYSRTGTPRWEDVQAAYDSAYGALQNPMVRDSRDYQEGLSILEAYHEANRERPCQPVLLEHKFEVALGGHTLVGAIDRVDVSETGYEVIDYKLDRELRTQAAVEEDLQLGLYHLAIAEERAIQPEALTLYFLRHNVQRTTSLSSARAGELRSSVIQAGDAIEADRAWTPCAGDHCTGCDFRAVCPAHTGRPAPPAPERIPASARIVGAKTQLRLEFGSELTKMPMEVNTAPPNQLTLPL
jgi:CRISPR/Cas system-associated exonuclease Cas4 (RecB family)